MSGVRKTIFDNLEAGLKTITVTNGYGLSVETVSQLKHTDTSMRNQGTPAINIIDMGDKSVKRFATDNMAIIAIDLEIHGEDLHQMIDDTRKYLNSASLGVNALYIKDGDIEPPEKGEDKANFTVNIDIGYYYTRSDP
jgi:hypothetical protein